MKKFFKHVSWVKVSFILQDIRFVTVDFWLGKFFEQNLDIVPKEENKSFLTFAIPRDKEELLPVSLVPLYEL